MLTGYRAQDLGSFRNALGILTSDLKQINTKGLLAATGLNPSQLQKITGVARPQFYRKSVSLKQSPKLIKRIKSLVMATDIAYELFDKNIKETAAWLMSPNTVLFGESPFDVCMRGEGEGLINWLNQRLGRNLESHAS